MAIREKKYWSRLVIAAFVLAVAGWVSSCATGPIQKEIRLSVSLNSDWLTVANDTNQQAYSGFEKVDFDVSGWKKVDVPHNWDEYQGFRQMKHGNRHGYAWYRKTFSIDSLVEDSRKRYFLWFEGVGSYATVWLNGQQVGEHAGGRTTFTLDVTEAIKIEGENLLAVRADHPPFIADLPWVCGGCSSEWGFSEGSQPMGIFRPVHLIATDPLRVEPFGVHIWNDETISEEAATLYVNTELKNYGGSARNIEVVNTLVDPDGNETLSISKKEQIPPGETVIVKQKTPEIKNPRLWSTEDPALYRMITEVREGGKTIDRISTRYGIRWISWPIDRDWGGNQFFLNGKPVFINGICEYEHNMGQSHAFTGEQVMARTEQMHAAGFNAFRDAHQPHNFLYHKYWDEHGILFWTQMSAHIWYDTDDFKNNFKKLLRDWVKERRNSPSVVLWGLQNESVIPEDFARECTQIIREMDPTASAQRKVTTCNGGTGTDWNVIQNWSGTYGGDPEKYEEELSRQILNGEYGAWRSIDFHTEGPFVQDGPWSEDRMTLLMEMKVRLGEAARDSSAGQFHWLFNSHENPGRVQNGEGYRQVDQVGPVNYKGLVTAWGEPLDVYYMFRSNYAPKDTQPMAYIVSHTWPDRWTTPGVKDSLIVYSNCDEVELFNDVENISLGKRKKNGKGTHFLWNNVDIKYNVLYAVGYVDGKPVARDYIVLHHLPESPGFDKLKENAKPITKAAEGYNYLYRVNCGGPDYIDQHGQLWQADVQRSSVDKWGSTSWTDEYPNMPAFYASQRRTHDPIQGTADWPLFQTFRYGIDKLKFHFPVPDGEYRVELYFTEPWYGTGGGLDCAGWRIFDVGVNNETVIKDLDIWKESGHDAAFKKTINAEVKGGELTVWFPKVTAGQGLISAIAIATKDANEKPAPASASLISALQGAEESWSVQRWMDTGQKQFSTGDAAFSALPPELYTAEWIRTSGHQFAGQATFKLSKDASVYVAVDSAEIKPEWLTGFEESSLMIKNNKGESFKIFIKEFARDALVRLGKGRYTVAAVTISEMGEEPQARPMIRYEAEDAVLSGDGFSRAHYRKEDYLQFSDSNENQVQWEINPGLAGTYLLRFRYMNMSGEPVPVRLQIIAADGTVMRDDHIVFPPAPQKWRSLNTTTGSTINAGHYKVIITGSKAAGLRIDALEFQ